LLNTEKDKPLGDVASEDYLDIVKFLIKNGANINLQDKSGYTRLYYAITLSPKSVVELLIKNGADINLQDNNNNTPLHIALLLEKLDVAKLLIKNKAKINEKNKYDQTPLNLAASKGHQTIAITLIKKGANIQTQDKLGNSPLHWAAKTNQIRLVKKIISTLKKKGKGALKSAINLKNTNEETPLALAEDNNNTEIQKILENPFEGKWSKTKRLLKQITSPSASTEDPDKMIEEIKEI